MIPVLQFADLDILTKASAHLESLGHLNKITTLDALPEDEHTEWMVAENGGHLLYFNDDDHYEAAMTALGEFFGYSPDE